MPDGPTETDPLVQIAGGLGFSGVSVGLAVMLLACAGVDGALIFGIVPVALGVADITLIGIRLMSPGRNKDAAILAAAFGAIVSILGGLLQIAAWRHWPILYVKPI